MCSPSSSGQTHGQIHGQTHFSSRQTRRSAPTITMRPLEYLLRFLDAYNFSGQQGENEHPDKLISAAVLGLIFEKINGYKDGSFFTPSFITMYMCRETIGRAVIQKFNEAKNWNCQSINDLYNKIDNIDEANKIFKTIRICDPAVGSGHFLVSALNEMVYLKSELGILADKHGKRLKDYRVTIENDELLITDMEGNYFTYNPQNAENRRVQETFFNEKQTIIENCLFGVDINPNSVKICQLRLWIELLKHAYYTMENGELRIENETQNNSQFSILNSQLKTLPNIDINIKCGNSLMSRFDLADKYHNIPGMEQKVKQATQKYKAYVALYKITDDKNAKRQIVKNIETEKDNFFRIPNAKDPDYQNLQKAHNELNLHRSSLNYFEAENDEWNAKTAELTEKVNKNEQIYNEKKRGCFEWRFEFPEVLDENGNFIGFDVVIGNPPYISAPTMVNTNPRMRQAIADSKRYSTLYQKWDIFVPFMELGLHLLTSNGIFAMIVPYPLTNQIYAKKIRELIVNQCNLIEITDLSGTKVFDKATVTNCIPFIIKSRSGSDCYISHINEQRQISRTFRQTYADLVQDAKTAVWNLTSQKRETNRHAEMNVLGDFCYISVGMVLNADEKTAKGEFTKDDLISETYNTVHCRKYIEAKDIERYRVKKIRYLEYNTARCPDKLRRPTFRELYEKPKLLHNSIGNLMVFLDEDNNFLHNHSLSCGVLWKDLKEIDNKSIKASVKRYSRLSRQEMEKLSENIDLHFLLGILNSKYAGVLLTNIRGGYINIYPEHLRNLPIPLVTTEQQQSIIFLVEQILSAKKENAAADTLEWEQKIDGLVYELYGLTEEEIEVVEKA
jgi:adenine-specific DNA-methyltransferase